jgi:CheY-like chemotaxis protein
VAFRLYPQLTASALYSRLNTISLALLDVMLPGLSGLEVLQRIRNSQDGHTRQMPVVMLSALANKANPEVDQTLGVTKFLAKPFQSADLLELVSTILTADTG